VVDKSLAGSIQSKLGYECGIRLHSDKLLSQVKDSELEKGQLGLGHSYSRAKVKFYVNRNGIRGIFPELIKIVSDNYQYAKLAKFIKNKSDLTEEGMDDLMEIIGDESKS
ncbi:16716_t:CDS:2, partial [Funneliformis geosporum]